MKNKRTITLNIGSLDHLKATISQKIRPLMRLDPGNFTIVVHTDEKPRIPLKVTYFRPNEEYNERARRDCIDSGREYTIPRNVESMRLECVNFAGTMSGANHGSTYLYELTVSEYCLRYPQIFPTMAEKEEVIPRTFKQFEESYFQVNSGPKRKINSLSGPTPAKKANKKIKEMPPVEPIKLARVEKTVGDRIKNIEEDLKNNNMIL